MSLYYVVRVNRAQYDTFAAETLAYALELAQSDPGSILEYATVDARDAGAARIMPIERWARIPSKRLYVAMRANERGTLIRRYPSFKEDELPEGYCYCIGPFRTVAAAEICAKGEHSPSVQSVAQFERLAQARKVGQS